MVEKGGYAEEGSGLDAESMRIFRDCLREYGIGGLDLIPDPVNADCSTRALGHNDLQSN